MYADDLILLAQATIANTSTIIEIINQLSIKFGQRINFRKSKLFFANNVNSTLSQTISRSLNIPIATNFSEYLGFPITTNQPKSIDYQYIIDQIITKFSS